jgi:hypothetical protein
MIQPHHMFNPVIQTLDRFDLSLKDKNNNIYQVSDIDSSKLICMYIHVLRKIYA